MDFLKRLLLAVTAGVALTLAILWFFGPPPWGSNQSIWARAEQADLALNRQLAGLFADPARAADPAASTGAAVTPPTTATLAQPTAAALARPTAAALARPTATGLAFAGPTLAAGSTHVATMQPAPATTAEATTPALLPPPPGGVYIVQAGDSLQSIAARYGTTVNALLSTNNLTRRQFVWVGQQLMIPGSRPIGGSYSLPGPAGSPAARAAGGPSTGAPAGASGIDPIHVVRPGDTLTTIARQYRVSVDAILKANVIADHSRLQIGMQLSIPSIAAAPAPVATPVATAVRPKAPAVAKAPTATPVTKAGLPGKLVFQTATGLDVYLIRADGTGLIRLAQGAMEPALSPDGTCVAFTRWGEKEGIYTIRTNGTDEKLVFSAHQPRQPAWSPDGKRIAFSFQKDSQTTESHGKDGKLYRNTTYFWRTAVVNADGSGFTELPSNSNQSFSPTWSPDSTRVAYSGSDGLVVTGVDGFYRELTHGDWQQSPAWSPDGARLAFIMKRADHFDIYVRAMGLDLSAEQRLLTTNKGIDIAALTVQPMYADQPVNSVSPAWSPDGQHLAFLTDRDEGRWRIYVMNADGSDQRPMFGPALDGLAIKYDFASEKSLDWGR